jgi:hypothetical protein
MRPSVRRSIATPLADLGFALVTDTKSQQPSLLPMVLKGWPGSEMKETGSAGDSLQRADAFAPCADIDEHRNTTNNATPASRFASDITSTGFLMAQDSFHFENVAPEDEDLCAKVVYTNFRAKRKDLKVGVKVFGERQVHSLWTNSSGLTGRTIA